MQHGAAMIRPVLNVAKAVALGVVTLAVAGIATTNAKAVVSRVDVLAGKAVRAGNAKVAKLAERVREAKRAR